MPRELSIGALDLLGLAAWSTASGRETSAREVLEPPRWDYAEEIAEELRRLSALLHRSRDRLDGWVRSGSPTLVPRVEPVIGEIESCRWETLRLAAALRDRRKRRPTRARAPGAGATDK